MRVSVKICGLKTREAIDASAKGGADFIGFVFHSASPRNLTLDAAARLRRDVPPGVKLVALTVDAGDMLVGDINRTVSPDVFQLHGGETPKRAAEIHALTGKAIIKAIPVARPEDIAAALAFEGVADWLMFDAKAPAGAASPGGAGVAFDWRILSGRSFRRPWFLASGLNPENLKEAVLASGARLVDVSSGVERARGEKDPALIAAFLDRARTL
ncbi:MAG: phosphoribosylanthranilate isomerase [Alphaproteobacteria bacterium]